MRNCLLVFILVFLNLKLSSQSKKEPVVYSDTVFNIKKQNVPAKVIYTLDPIYQIQLEDHHLTLYLRGKRGSGALKDVGYITRLNKQFRLLFNFKISYRYENFLSEEDLAIHYTATDSYVKDAYTGKNKYKIEHRLIHADLDREIGLGYRLQEFNSNINRLEGIDLKNGTKIWEKEVFKEDREVHIYIENDTSFYVLGLGLYQINPLTGEGWSYVDSALIKAIEVKKAVGTSVIIGFGLMGFAIYHVVSDNQLYQRQSSNVLFTDKHVYYASVDHLSKLNLKDGTIIWKSEFPEKFDSESIHFNYKDRIIHLSLGYISKGEKHINSSIPFISSYNKKNGEENYFKELSTSKYRIHDYQIKEDTLTLIQKSRLKRINLNSGELFQDKTIHPYDNSSLDSIESRPLYYLSEQQMHEHKFPESSFQIHLNDGFLYVFNKDITLNHKINRSELYYKREQIGSFQLFANDKTLIICDLNNYNLTLSFNCNNYLIRDNKLYISKGNILTVIELSLMANN